MEQASLILLANSITQSPPWGDAGGHPLPAPGALLARLAWFATRKAASADNGSSLNGFVAEDKASWRSLNRGRFGRADGPVHQHRIGNRPGGGRDDHLADRTTATEATVSLEDGSDNATRQPTVGRSVVSGATNPRGPKRWFHTRLLQPLQGASFIIGQRPRYVLIYPRQSYPSTSIEARCPDRSTPVASDCWHAVEPSGHCWLASVPFPTP